MTNEQEPNKKLMKEAIFSLNRDECRKAFNRDEVREYINRDEARSQLNTRAEGERKDERNRDNKGNDNTNE